MVLLVALVMTFSAMPAAAGGGGYGRGHGNGNGPSIHANITWE